MLLSALFLCAKSFAGSGALYYTKHEAEKKEENLVFIHGTPGDHKAFDGFMKNSKLKQRFNMISVDRLGFGKSAKKAETSFEKQNEDILKVVKKEFKSQKVTCIGHSYGGPLCLKLSIDHPEIFNKTLLIAGVFNPNRKIIRWYNKFASLKIISWILPRGLKNSNKEMYDLKRELKALKTSLPKVKSLTYLIHGRKDKIVPFSDSMWLSAQLPKDKVEFLKLDEAGHFVLWKKEGLIVNEIMKLAGFIP